MCRTTTSAAKRTRYWIGQALATPGLGAQFVAGDSALTTEFTFIHEEALRALPTHKKCSKCFAEIRRVESKDSASCTSSASSLEEEESLDWARCKLDEILLRGSSDKRTEFAAAGWSLKSSNSSIVTGDQLRKSQFARLFRWVAGVIHGLDTCRVITACVWFWQVFQCWLRIPACQFGPIFGSILGSIFGSILAQAVWSARPPSYQGA